MIEVSLMDEKTTYKKKILIKQLRLSYWKEYEKIPSYEELATFSREERGVLL